MPLSRLVPFGKNWSFKHYLVYAQTHAQLFGSKPTVPNNNVEADMKECDPKKKNSEAVMEKFKNGKEIGGPVGLEPTRFGDWERKGRISDF
jgi:hypothetical protein